MLTCFSDCAPAFTPFATRTKLEANSDDTPNPQFCTWYQQIVRSLMYAMLGSQPDICFAINRLAQYGSNPSKQHLNAALHVLRYLELTRAHQMTYGWNDCSELIEYSNSDWAADTDTQCSTTGFCFLFTGGSISWMTWKQHTVALSSTEAKYMALTTCVKHGKWTFHF